MSVGENIRKYRKQYNNMSAKELANKVDLKSAQAILQYERGDRQPSIEILIKIATVLEVPVQNLIEPDESTGNFESEMDLLMQMEEDSSTLKQNVDILTNITDNNLYDFKTSISFIVQDVLVAYERYDKQEREQLSISIKQLSDIISLLSSYIYRFSPEEINSSLKEIFEFIRFKFEITHKSDKEGE